MEVYKNIYNYVILEFKPYDTIQDIENNINTYARQGWSLKFINYDLNRYILEKKMDKKAVDNMIIEEHDHFDPDRDAFGAP